ncbi:MAG TPA: Lrp/AsnC ligand binding domain-containing protein [Atribacter sp.]|jgi:DNA-binding Lrp family transcriptional regulator|uniref:AsnC family protein n=2 Tax=Atribacter TaxID=2847777 RepID=A0A1V5SIM4_9BACT|nr:Lrp/AsnC ligand binding domain-containing protein [Atribacter sp.]MDD3713395.1 Lrp/AsnC ligand binding domain-containing protein [Atribacterota bacterium]OQA54305.1 MAG: AsnC family protein [Candidatus Atribacteria bacterium ADurb.Bin276]HHT09696.1 Lrp/AsnC family transcriptional regulator [Candidatus Atribacteria bacterium]MDI9594266.1 Lrp/AsnC ligand binding domain-containing protein [Atribacterota bacterium]HQK82443.1 Lrp/AsnC ligand binding domain-containing protein [Atribacter sp.]
MVVQAYLLLQVQVGKAQNVKKELALYPWVIRIDRVMGPFDLILLVEVEDNQEIGERLLKEIQRMREVKSTLTCPII